MKSNFAQFLAALIFVVPICHHSIAQNQKIFESKPQPALKLSAEELYIESFLEKSFELERLKKEFPKMHWHELIDQTSMAKLSPDDKNFMMDLLKVYPPSPARHERTILFIESRDLVYRPIEIKVDFKDSLKNMLHVNDVTVHFDPHFNAYLKSTCSVLGWALTQAPRALKNMVSGS